MSRTQTYPVLEWSRSAVRLFDPATRKLTTADNLAGLGHLPKEVILALSRRTTFLRMVALPSARREDLRAIVGIQLGNHFPVPAHELAFDFVQTDEVTPDGKKVLIVGVRQADLRQAFAALKEHGVKIVKTVPTALGSSSIVEEGSAAVLENTPEGIAVDLVQGGLTQVSRLASPSSLGGLSAEVERTYQASGMAPGTVIATGGLEFNQANRSLPTSPLEGLALHGAASVLNLELPEEVLGREAKQTAQRGRFATLLAASALLFGVLVWDDRERAAEVVRKGEAKWNNDLRKLRSIRDGIVQDSQKKAKNQATTAVALQPAQRAADVLAVFTNSAPPGVWLTGYNFDRGKPIQVRGAARNSAEVKQYLSNLEQQRRLRDVRLSFANTGRVDDTPIIQFSITAVAVGNLPLAAPDKKRAKS